MNKHKIYPLKLGTFGMNKSFMTWCHDPDVDVSDDFPVQFFYIEGPKENIIVDTGGPAQEINKYWFGGEDKQTFKEALSKVNITPEDIDKVIITHGHFDHVLNLRNCPNAKVYIQKEELKFAYSPHPLMRALYNPEFYRDVKFIQIEGDVEIVPGVKTVFLPGHTPGTQGVAVETAQGVSLITGFCCLDANFTECPEPFKDNWNNMIPIGVSCSTTQALDSMFKAKGLADIIIPSHGMELPEVIG